MSFPAAINKQKKFLNSCGCITFSAEFVLSTFDNTPFLSIGISPFRIFSIRNNFVDCAFAAGFGLLGYILRRLNWPLVPIVLGMVLGSIMIEKLTAGASKIKFWSDIINRPVSGTLAFIIFLVIIVTLISYIRNYNKKNI